MVIVRKPDIHVGIFAFTKNATEVLYIRSNTQTIEFSSLNFDPFLLQNIDIGYSTFSAIRNWNADSFP